MGIKDYKDKATRDIARGERSKASLKALPVELHRGGRIKLAQFAATNNINELRNMRSLNLEKFKGDRKGFWSIRIDDQYRITFKWKDDAGWEVKVEDYH